MLRGMTERANTRLHDGPAATTTAVTSTRQQKQQWQHSATAALATTIQTTPSITSTNSNSSPCTRSTSRACASSISGSRCNGNDGHTRIYSASKIGDDGKTNGADATEYCSLDKATAAPTITSPAHAKMTATTAPIATCRARAIAAAAATAGAAKAGNG